MSAAQLQSIFHVDSQDLVPHYELIKLTHHGSTHHHISKRNVNNNLQTIDLDQKKAKADAHHVKKDLSKSAYYSEFKNALNPSDTTNNNDGVQSIVNNISDNSSSSNSNNSSGSNLSDSDTISKNVDLSKLSEHNVSLSAFGDVYNLTLRPTDGLFKDGPQFMKMWTVHTDPNATQGLQYDEVIQVRFYLHTLFKHRSMPH